MYASNSQPDTYTADYVSELEAAYNAIAAERETFYSGLRSTGGWEITESSNRYQDEIDWLTGYKDELSLQESTRAAAEAARQEMEAAKNAALALESAGLYNGRRMSEEEIAEMDVELSRVLDNAKSLYETAYNSTTTSSQVAHYKRAMETAETNYNNFIAALPYIASSSLYQAENDYINDVGTARKDQDSKTTIKPFWWQSSDDVSLFKQGGVQDWRQYTFMTEAERTEYNRLRDEEGDYVAAAYLDALTKGALNARYGYDIAQGNSDAAKVGAQLVYGFKDTIGNIPELWSGEEHDPSAWEYASQYMLADNANNANFLGTGKSANQLLQGASYSAGRQIPAMMLGNAVGLGSGLQAAGAFMGNAFMGLSSAGAAYEMAVSEGYNSQQARLYGALVGVTETVLGHVLSGLGGHAGFAESELLSKVAVIDNGILRFAATTGTNVAGEVSEEVLQSYLEPLYHSWFFSGEYDAPTFTENLETVLTAALTSAVLSSGQALDMAVSPPAIAGKTTAPQQKSPADTSEAGQDSTAAKTNQVKTVGTLAKVKVPSYEELVSKPNIPVVDIRKTTEGNYAEQRKSFLSSQTAAELYKGPITNKDTGADLFVTPHTFTHTFSNRQNQQENINMVGHMREIVETAVLTHSEMSRKADRDHTTGVYTFFGAVNTDAGVQPVKLTVKEYRLEGQSLPQTIKAFFQNMFKPETYASVYDGKVLVVENIEKEGTNSSVLATVEQRPTMDKHLLAPSEISVKDLLSLVKGEVRRYIPDAMSRSQQAQTLTAVAHTSQERTALGKYKNAVKLLENRQAQLARTQAEMQRLASEGRTRTPQYDKLRGDAAELNRMVTEAERKVQQLKNSATVKGLRDKAESGHTKNTSSNIASLDNNLSISRIDIDELTPCLRRIRDNQIVETEVVEIKPTKKDFSDWEFDWTIPQRNGFFVRGIKATGDDRIQGLIAMKPESRNRAVHIDIVEAAPFNNPHNKKFLKKEYSGVGGHLFAEAVRESFAHGFGGYVYFMAKSDLIEHYQRELGAVLINPRERIMAIEEGSAKLLYDRYYKTER